MDDLISWYLYKSINGSEVKTVQSKDESSQSYSVGVWSMVGGMSGPWWGECPCSLLGLT